MGIEYKFDMVQSEDGSGLGAAIIAAVVAKQVPSKINTEELPQANNTGNSTEEDLEAA